MYGGVEMNEPVAMRYDFDGYGYMYIDSGSGSDWKTRENGEFLYIKPFFSQKPVAMMVKIDGFDKPEFTTTCSSAALKHPNYNALYDHPPIAFAELEAGESIPLYEHPEILEDRESAIYATGYWNGIAYKNAQQTMIPIYTRPRDETTTLTLSIVPSEDGKTETIYLLEVKK